MPNGPMRRVNRRLLQVSAAFCVLCATLFLPCRLEPQAKKDGDNSVGTVVIDLPVFTNTDMYQALAGSITDLGNGRWAFPVDILAAAYGRYDEGWQKRSWWVPYVEKSRMQAIFSRSKRYVETPTLPAFIAVNVPGLGLNSYDARYIRSLIETDLFPDRMHIVKRKREKSPVSYVILEPAHAAFAHRCFEEAAQKTPPACPRVQLRRKTKRRGCKARVRCHQDTALRLPIRLPAIRRDTGTRAQVRIGCLMPLYPCGMKAYNCSSLNWDVKSSPTSRPANERSWENYSAPPRIYVAIRS